MTYDAVPRRSRLFTVRIWTEAVEKGTEHRGSVRDVVSGAHRSFRQWPDLTSFLADQLEEDATIEEET